MSVCAKRGGGCDKCVYVCERVCVWMDVCDTACGVFLVMCMWVISYDCMMRSKSDGADVNWGECVPRAKTSACTN